MTRRWRSRSLAALLTGAVLACALAGCGPDGTYNEGFAAGKSDFLTFGATSSDGMSDEWVRGYHEGRAAAQERQERREAEEAAARELAEAVAELEDEIARGEARHTATEGRVADDATRSDLRQAVDDAGAVLLSTGLTAVAALDAAAGVRVAAEAVGHSNAAWRLADATARADGARAALAEVVAEGEAALAATEGRVLDDAVRTTLREALDEGGAALAEATEPTETAQEKAAAAYATHQTGVEAAAAAVAVATGEWQVEQDRLAAEAEAARVAAEQEAAAKAAAAKEAAAKAAAAKKEAPLPSTGQSSGGGSSSSGGSGGAGGNVFKNCKAARAAGAAPVYRGDPGYGKHLDRDGDGVGCE